MLLVPVANFAQGDPGVCDNEIDCPVPIDEWLAVLLLVGAVYGFFKYRKAAKATM